MNKIVQKKKRNRESGQSIVEFLLVVSIILTTIFMYVQLSWSIAFGHYVHYATFIAARTYFSGGRSKQDQMDGAVSVLQGMLKAKGGKDILAFIGKSRGGDDRDITGTEPVTGAFIGTHPQAVGLENSRYFSWAEGVQFNFGIKIFMLPLAGWVKSEGKGKSIQTGTKQDPGKSIEFKGAIPMTSDAFLGRESTFDECVEAIKRLSNSAGISRADGATFIEDNGC